MKNFETSLTNFLLVLILIFLGVIINKLSYIDISNEKIASNTYATFLELGRDKVNNGWTKEEYKNLDKYYENLFNMWNDKK